MKRFISTLCFALLSTMLLASVSAQSLRDGRLYDQGRTMQERSPRADATLDQIKSILGQWQVAVTTYPTDSTTHTTTGQADIAYMNRGYAYMTRMHIPGYDEAGNEANLMSFLTFNPAAKTWILGEASSYSESISMYNGDFQNEELVLSTGVRRQGSILLTTYRLVYAFTGDDTFTSTLSTSTDNGKSWKPAVKQRFTRMKASQDFMMTHEGVGKPSPDRPAETAQFDFLIGEWSAAHQINFQGQWIKYTANTNAVYAMNGHGIMEYSWHEMDPNLPDAATTIIRLYNRSMRRWESLYLTNRGNAPLFFGGQKEGDDIILHTFEANTADGSIPKYVFHDITPDKYGWYAETSSDRGKTFNKTWIIDISRVKDAGY